MNPMSSGNLAIVAALGALCFVGNAAFSAEAAPDGENGRYTFSPMADGVMRLDTKTGTVSNCSSSAAGWACYAVPDERKALDEEIGRLQAENEKLKAQLALRDPSASASGDSKSGDKQAAPNITENQRKIEIPLPSDQDVDRVMSFLQRAWKRLIDMANQMQKDSSSDGRI